MVATGGAVLAAVALHAAREAVMKRLTLCRYSLRAIWVLSAALALTCAAATVALAQHAAGHVGGVVHVNAPPAPHPMISRPAVPLGAPLVGVGTRSFVVRPPAVHFLPAGTLLGQHSSGVIVGHPRRPIPPRLPVFPMVPPALFGPPTFGLFGFPFFDFGLGLGFNSGLWPSCDLFLTWEFGCNGLPGYGYGPGYDLFAYSPPIMEPQVEIQNWPIYVYGDENLRFVRLYLKDGTVYNVTDYWLVDDQLHFKTIEENGTKLVEHGIAFDQLDLQKTIDVNTQRGFRFVLRNRPIEQYLQEHPSSGSPNGAPVEPSQAPTPPAQPGPPPAQPQAPLPQQPQP
jgi:hypothetical protein